MNKGVSLNTPTYISNKPSSTVKKTTSRKSSTVRLPQFFLFQRNCLDSIINLFGSDVDLISELDDLSGHGTKEDSTPSARQAKEAT